MRPHVHSGVVLSGLQLFLACAPNAPGNEDSRDDESQLVTSRLGFPGAGKSSADVILPNANLKCLYAAGATSPSAAIEYVLEVFHGRDAVHARVTFDPTFVDNTYGVNAIGWERHTFRDLVGSDHAELLFLDASASTVLDAKIDYISEDGTGHASLGVSGGEGDVLAGSAADVLAWSTSMDRNLNERGYGTFITDSPATDANYTPAADAPNWDYRVVYELWVAEAAFANGFGDVDMTFVHASPSKAASNTLEIEDGDCPPDWDAPCEGEVCAPVEESCRGELCEAGGASGPG